MQECLECGPCPIRDPTMNSVLSAGSVLSVYSVLSAFSELSEEFPCRDSKTPCILATEGVWDGAGNGSVIRRVFVKQSQYLTDSMGRIVRWKVCFYETNPNWYFWDYTIRPPAGLRRGPESETTHRCRFAPLGLVKKCRLV